MRVNVSQAEKQTISASTVLLIRDGVDGLEVFMVVRHTEIVSFSGALVFPGGKVDPEDIEARLDAKQLTGIEARWRADLTQGKITMADVCRTEGLVLALDKMVHYAHWITPRVVPKVFDTQFFVARAPVDHVALHDGRSEERP